jgi:hypothetical protein
MEADSDWQDQNVQKILKTVTILGSAITTPVYYNGQLFSKFKYENVSKIKNKPDLAYHQLHIYSMKSKKHTKISWDYPFKSGLFYSITAKICDWFTALW